MVDSNSKISLRAIKSRLSAQDRVIARDADVRAAINEFYDGKLESKVNSPYYQKFREGLTRTSWDKVYTFDGMSVLTKVKLGHAYKQGYEHDHNIVTVEEDNAYHVKTEQIYKEHKEKTEEAKRKVAEIQAQQKDTMGMVKIETRNYSEPSFPWKLRGHLVDNKNDKNLLTSYVTEVKPIFTGVKLQSEMFRAIEWRRLIEAVSEKYDVQIGSTNFNGKKEDRELGDEGDELYIQRSIIKSKTSLSTSIEKVYKAGKIIRNAIDSENEEKANRLISKYLK